MNKKKRRELNVTSLRKQNGTGRKEQNNKQEKRESNKKIGTDLKRVERGKHEIASTRIA